MKPLMSEVGFRFIAQRAALSVRYRKLAKEMRAQGMLHSARICEAKARAIEAAIRALA